LDRLWLEHGPAAKLLTQRRHAAGRDSGRESVGRLGSHERIKQVQKDYASKL
jgi:hypothetical protein